MKLIDYISGNNDFTVIDDVSPTLVLINNDSYCVSLKHEQVSEQVHGEFPYNIIIEAYKEEDKPPNGFSIYGEKHTVKKEDDLDTVIEHAYSILSKLTERDIVECPGCHTIAMKKLIKRERIKLIGKNWFQISNENLGGKKCVVTSGLLPPKIEIYSHREGNPLFNEEELESVSTLSSVGYEGTVDLDFDLNVDLDSETDVDIDLDLD